MSAPAAGVPAPALTARAWQNAEVRRRIEQYVLQKNYRGAPELGAAFLTEMNRIIPAAGSEEEIYARLRDFFEHTAGLQSGFVTERSTRLGRRSEQIRELLEGRKASSLLDVGCGAGEITNELRRSLQIPPPKVKGLEVVLEEGTRGRFPFDIIEFDGANFPDLGQTFELVTLLSVLHHAREPVRLIQEVVRVLAPGGWVIVRECDASTEDVKLFNLIIDYLWYRVYTPCPDVPITGNYRSQAAWEAVFNQQGLTVVRTTNPDPTNAYNPCMMLLARDACG